MKTAIITGGGRGLGKSITESFLSAGYKVFIGARTQNGLEHLQSENTFFCETDVRNEEQHENLANTALNLTGRIDAWINNAGVSSWRPIEGISGSFLDEVINTNLKSVFWGCKVAAKAMEVNGGAIINISSIAGKRGSANNSAYCASKFGVNGLTQSLAKELGKLGITVNAICPVLIKTDGLITALRDEHSPAKGDPESFIHDFTILNSATGKLPEGQDVGKFAVFLASPENKAITGQCINIDCGVFPQ